MSTTDYLSPLLYGTSAETDSTLGTDRLDYRIPDTQYRISGLQISRIKNLLKSITTDSAGGTRLKLPTGTSNRFAVGEYGVQMHANYLQVVRNGGTAEMVPSAALSAKGDLIGFTGTAFSRLAVGGDGQVLTADAASAGGIKWASTTGDATTIQGRAMAATAPTDGQVIAWNNGGSTWQPSSTAILNSVTSASNTTLTLKSNQADGASPQVTVDTTNAVTGAHPLLRVANAGTKVMELQVQSSTHYLQFYDSGGAATSALVFNNSPGIYVYNTNYFHPFSNNATALGATGNRWVSMWSRAYYGTEQTASTSGAVSIDPSLGETFKLTATGNVTSIAVADGQEGQTITLVLVQDGGGTSTWPSTISNARLAGGSFSKTTAASGKDSITLRWETGLSDWLEISRALNLS